MNFQRKKILLFVIIILVLTYAVWNVSVRFANHFRFQGYETAVREIIEKAESEECEVFNVYAGEKEVKLVNVNCFYERKNEY